MRVKRPGLLLATAIAFGSVVNCLAANSDAGATPAGVIPFTAATVTERPGGTYAITWRAAAKTGQVTVYAGTNPLVDSRRNEVGSGGPNSTIVATPPDIPGVTRWYFTLTPTNGAPLVLADRSLHLADAPNLRDVGGYRTSDGQWVRMGVLYRSGALSELTPADDEVLGALNIDTVVDLRTQAEATSAPDKLPSGTNFVFENVLAAAGGTGNTTAAAAALFAAPRSATVSEATNVMRQLYDELPTLSSANSSYAALYRSIVTEPAGEALLFHCTAGKDRTGWAAAALLLELGVPLPTVERDYLLSNVYVLPSYSGTVASFVAQGGNAAALDAVLGVQAQYLQDSLAVVRQRYGSVQRYFTKALGLDRSSIARLRSLLLEGAPD